MKIDIITTVNVDSTYQADEIALIFKALIDSGALLGVKGGSSLIHFDKDGIFQGIGLDYKPWWRRRDS